MTDTKDPRIPDWFAERVTRAGGTTLDGRPKVRVVHGDTARGFPMPERGMLKYLDPEDASKPWDCFILEEFRPPEFFGDRDLWDRLMFEVDDEGNRRQIMAPFPYRGEYVFVQPLVAPSGLPFAMTEQVAEYIEFLITLRRAQADNAYSTAQMQRDRIEAMRKAREEKERERAERLEVIADDMRRRAEVVNAGETRVMSLPSGEVVVRDRRRVKERS